MAKTNVIGKYDARSVISTFRGLMQYGDGVDTDPRFASEESNMETIGGVLQPAAACRLLSPVLQQPIETLARLYRRWHTEPQSKEVLIAASGGKLYYWIPGNQRWTQLAMPSGVTAYASNVWSWAAYEVNEAGSDASVDVLLLSNAIDGMVMVRGDDMSVVQVPTPKKFGVIERSAERIWGGAITDDPDMLVYSSPFDPTNWEADVEHPEDGAGDIMQPSWDGDSFTALRSFGSQIIAFKRTRVWRIQGTDPGSYTFKEQYGGGAAYPGTIAVNNEQIIMLSRQGLQVYDGLSVNPFQQQYCKDIWERMNSDALEHSAGIFWRNKYYCAIPIDASPINNAVVIYDPLDGSWLLRDDVCVERFLGTEDFLYFTSSTAPGKLYVWQEDSWSLGQATTAPTKWVTHWNDFGRMDIVKGSFEVYLLAEAKDKPLTLKISLQTEKKLKTKKCAVTPLTEAEIAKPKNYKQKRLHFGGTGRRFRLIIETDADTPAWRLIGGIMIVSDIDPD